MMLRFSPVLALLVLGLSAPSTRSSVDEFVSSGEYMEARRALADCSRTFFPALDDVDRSSGGLSFASTGRAGGGDNLLYLYRPLDGALSGAVTEFESASARWQRYEDPRGRFTMTSASISTPQGCTRMYIKADPPVLQVGLPARDLTGLGRLASNFSDLLPPGYTNSLHRTEVLPGEGEIVIIIFVDGTPKRDADVYMYTDARGDPGKFGSTFAHEHLVTGPFQFDPTIMIEGQRELAEEVVGRTDTDGELRFWVKAGERGGAEAIVARAVAEGVSLGSCEELDLTEWRQGQCYFKSLVSVVVRDGNFRDFYVANGYGERPAPGPEFPFIVTGYTDDHNYSHFMESSKARAVASALQRIWHDDKNRIEADSLTETPHFLAIGNMSLEYGGAFKVGSGTCEEADDAPYITHDRGLDFDLSPCYTTGEEGQQWIEPNACRSSDGPKIDERVLVAHVVGRMGGVIMMHGSDGAPYSYHISLPGGS